MTQTHRISDSAIAVLTIDSDDWPVQQPSMAERVTITARRPDLVDVFRYGCLRVYADVPPADYDPDTMPPYDGTCWLQWTERGEDALTPDGTVTAVEAPFSRIADEILSLEVRGVIPHYIAKAAIVELSQDGKPGATGWPR